MRITTGQTIAGIPAVTLRKQFRKLRHACFSAAALGDRFLTEIADDPIASVTRLLEEGYLEGQDGSTIGICYRVGGPRDAEVNTQIGLEPPADVLLQLSTQGLALANATAAKPVKRATATKALDGLLQRVQQVHDDELAFDVGRVVLFGSYLDPDRETVGDVDVAIELVPRPLPAGESAETLRQRRIRAARESGHQFRSFFDELAWPEQEVLRRIKAGSRVLAIVEYHDHENFLARVPHRVIYENPSARETP